MRIVQISDSHISMDRPTRVAELEACVQRINAADLQPDVVVHTGDITHNGLIEEYETARRLLNGLKVPYFVLAGNRDKRQTLASAFADDHHIRPDMNFIQYAVECFDIRLICLDTVSDAGNKGRFCETRFAHAQAMLDADDNRPVALFLHHPPFEATVAPDPFQFEDWSEATALQALISQHNQICGVYCGHVHRQFASKIASVPAMVATCIASDLRWDDVTSCVYTYEVPATGSASL